MPVFTMPGLKPVGLIEFHSVHQGTPLKNTTPLFLAKPPTLNLEIVQAPPFLGNPPPLY